MLRYLKAYSCCHRSEGTNVSSVDSRQTVMYHRWKEFHESADSQISSGCRQKIPGSCNGRLTVRLYLLALIIALFPRLADGQNQTTDRNFYFNFTEEQPISTVVGQFPTVPGLQYRLSSVSALFVLDGNTGIIKTKARVDREDFSSDLLPLLVQSIPSPPVDLVDIQIRILDINDNAPTFSRSLIGVTFKENNRPGEWAVLLTATDPDAGPNGTIYDYTLVSGDENHRFRLNTTAVPRLLYLEANSVLDREEKSSYLLNISCHDGGVPPLFGFLLVNVTVTDINDNSPAFDSESYHVTISEASPVGTSIAQVHAVDPDAGQNAAITYSITGGNPDGQFQIDAASGVVTSTKILSCQTSCDPSVDSGCRTKMCVVTVQAQDGGQPYPLSSTVYLYVTLSDINDNSPEVQFPNLIGGQPVVIGEKSALGSIVMAVSISDTDDGQNGQVTARISGGNDAGDFSFVNSGLVGLYFIKVARTPFVTGSRYNLTIEARDFGTPPRFTYASLLITVGVVDAQPPTFDSSWYAAAVSENSLPGSYVAAVSARSSSGTIAYSIYSGNFMNWFRVDSSSGLVTTASPLNWTQRSFLQLTLQAEVSSKHAFTNVSITVLPGNKNPPLFSNSSYTVTLPASSPSGLTVATVSASLQNSNASVRYRFADSVQDSYPYTFQLDHMTGRIVTLRTLLTGTYRLTVLAVNSVDPLQYYSQVNVTVTVPPGSGRPPVIYPLLYFVRATDILPVGSPLVQILASDDNDSVIFSISGGPGSPKFSIDSRTGLLTTTQLLTASIVYNLTIMVRDSSGFISSPSATVQVFVSSGTSSVPPITFTQPLGYAFLIVEDDGRLSASTGRSVGQVSASISGLTYRIVDGDPDGTFSIGSSSGVISTFRAVDREQHAVYNLTVVAISSSNFAAVSVSIAVADLNDNVPQFLGGNTVSVDVKPTMPVGQDFYIATAADTDSGFNGTVRYSLSSNSSNLFTVNATTGLLQLAVPLEWRVTDSFNVYVIATDLGVPSLSSVQSVLITVLPANDLAPIFNASRTLTSVSESIVTNTRFFCVSSALINPPSTVFYEITRYHGTVDGKIRIFPDGCLYNVRALDRETTPQYIVTVRATDFGTIHNHSSSIDVVIEVLDENDNTPSFWNSTYTFSLIEGSPMEDFAEIVIASDVDEGRNADLLFSIEEPSGGFRIDAETGLLTSSRIIDREYLVRDTGRDTVTLTIVASDCGIVSRQARATVYIHVLDVNNKRPVFSSSLYDATIPEDTAINSTIVTVSAVDPDAGNNGSVSYSIVDDGGTGKQFSIDALSGRIILLSDLDVLQVNFFTLVVMARDAGTPVSLNTTTVVRISISFAFPRWPIWTCVQETVQVGKNALVGTLIASVAAVDPVTKRAWPVEYLLANTTGDAFMIEMSTGKIFLARELMHDQSQQFTLIAMAVFTTKDVRAGTASTSITVNVGNIADDTPRFVEEPNMISYHIHEDSTIGTSVFKAQAVSHSGDANTQMRYSIVQQIPSGHQFAIDSVTGIVTVAGTIDRETVATLHLIVSAFDQALLTSLRRTAQNMFTITVTSTEDNPPEFLSPDAVIISSTAVPGSLVTIVQAVDPDTGSNCIISYAFTGDDVSSSIFRIEPDSGRVYLVANLISTIPIYRLNITASNSGRPPGTSSLQLTVVVKSTSSSDDGPVFSRLSYAGQLMENSPATTAIVSVNASYPVRPGGLTPQIEYYIMSVLSTDGVRQPFYFDVVRTSGLIRSTRPLDRDFGPNIFVLDVCAVDRSADLLRTRNTTVLITVLDANDSPPLFTSYSSNLTVSEAERTGALIGSFNATDRDHLSVIRYSISSGLVDRRLAINSTTGDLVVADRLDRSQTSVYQLSISASDGLNVASVNVTVTVLGADYPTNNVIQFKLPVYTFDVREDASAGNWIGLVTCVRAMGRSSTSESDSFSYGFVSRWATSRFSLEPTLGILSVVGGLDFETLDNYALVVGCSATTAAGTPTAGPSSPMTANVTVYINIVDVNDNAPVFTGMTSSYVGSLWEDAAVGARVLSVTATDADTGVNGIVRYSIVDGDPMGQFTVDDQTGAISVAKQLDRETQSDYRLVVMATDQAADLRERLSSTAIVTVIIHDINDNLPLFTCPSQITIPESTPVGNSVFQVTASDADNNQITYSIIGDYSSSSTFSIVSSSGQLTVRQPLDRESKDLYLVTILAVDNGNPKLSSSLVLTVTIGDANDNDPVFSAAGYSAIVSESTLVGTVIMTVNATDSDIGLNGAIRYDCLDSFYSFSSFVIDGYSGEIRVRRSLDYDIRRTYNLVITARDLGTPSRSSTVLATILLSRERSKMPSFVGSPYVAEVFENQAPPVFVMQVSVLNVSGASIAYSLADLDIGPLFVVNSSTGVVTTAARFDREVTPVISFSVLAINSASVPALTATASVTVLVADANDNTPVFNHVSYEARVTENLPAGTLVTQPWATDLDSGRNAEIRYSLLRDTANDRFTIDRMTGQISTLAPLDREERSVYSLVVIATDRGLVPLTGSASVTVRVVDVNDNSPQFLRSSYATQIQNPTSAGSFVLGVIAVDQDEGRNGQILYFLNTSTNFFTINSTTGVITTSQQISSSTVNMPISLIVMASDLGQPVQTNTTFIDITFLPNSTCVFPQFSSSMQRTFQVSGNSDVGTPLGTVSATTLRPGVTALSYAVSGGNVGDKFEVESSTGTLRLKRVLEYWLLSSYSLWIEARDNGQPAISSYTQVFITITAFNKFAPEFNDLWYNATVTEESSPPVDVVTVTASDRDLGDAGIVRYVLVGSNPFSIDSTTGRITTAARLNREQTSRYQLSVLAYDQGSPSLTSTATIDIVVADINDNPPRFTQLFRASVFENSLPGTSVIQVTSTDVDTCDTTRYSLSTSTPASSLFTIDPLTGLITVAGNIDRDQSETLVIRVVANDGAFNTETAVTIDVVDENDNSPTCSLPSYNIQMVESRLPVTVANLSGNDSDMTSPNRDVFFRLRNWNHYFTVSSNSISWQRGFPFLPAGSRSSPLNVKHATLSIVDRGEPALASECLLNVRVFPENRFAPTFSLSSYSVVVPVNAAAGFVVAAIQASDNDTFRPNNEIEYRLQSSTDFFIINTLTGNVTLTKPMTTTNTSFLVTAIDHGIFSRNSAVLVNVVSIPANRFAPQFVGDQTAFTVTVPEDRPVGYLVSQVTATDADPGINGVVRYQIRAGNVDEMFTIDSLTGSIRIARSLDYEMCRRYDLEISARDSAPIAMESRHNFTIMVTDCNDNPPQFDRSIYLMSVSEDAPIGSTLGQLNATDADQTPNNVIQFYVVGGNASDVFHVLQFSGCVILNTIIDLSLASVYVITVQAVNPGSNLTAVTSIVIDILSINRHFPSFVSSHYDFVLPNVTGSSVSSYSIGSVSAVDVDSGVNGIVEYFLMGDSNLGNFSIDLNSGSIFLAVGVRVTSPSTTLYVIAKNPGQLRAGNFDTCTVIIRSLSAPPMLSFDRPVYTSTIREDSVVGTRVVRVVAVGFDITAMSAIFTIVGGNIDGAFGMDSQSGWIQVARKFDLTSSSEYNLTVSATISSSPPQTAVAQVIVTVSPVNISGPYFNPSIPLGTVVEHRAPNSEVILNLTAFTRDDNPGMTRGPFRYHQQDYLQVFSTDLLTGLVRALVSLDRSTASQYSITVLVDNAMSPPVTSSLMFTVLVLGTSDVCSTAVGGGATCLNGGSCISHTDGNVCQCRPADRGATCGIAAWTFEPLSYSERVSVVADASRIDISLDVSTIQQRALLVYLTSLGDRTSAFVAVEILSGQVQVDFRTSATADGIRRVTAPLTINDGRWHRIVAVLTSQGANVSVSDCPIGAADCNVCSQNNKTCSASLDNVSPLLLTTWPLVSVGGIRNMSSVLLRAGDVSTFDFTGCLRDVTLYGRSLLDAASATSANLSADSCSRRSSSLPCASGPCANGGTCVDVWTGFSCRCADGFVGDTCSKASSPFTTSGGGAAVIYRQKESYRRATEMEQALSAVRRRRSANQSPRHRSIRAADLSSSSLSLSFANNDSRGALVYASGPDGYTLIYISEEKVSYTSQLTSQRQQMLTADNVVAAGSWHNVTVTVRGSTVILSVDNGTKMASFSEQLHDPLGLRVDTVSVGGSSEPVYVNSKLVPGFSGCLGGFLVNGKIMTPEGSTDRFDVQPMSRLQYQCSIAGGLHATESPGKSSANWKIPVIVVLSIVGFILLAAILAAAIFCLWRKRKAAQAKDKLHNNAAERDSMKPKNGAVTRVNGLNNSSVRRNGNGRLATDEIRMTSLQPDVVSPELHPAVGRRWSRSDTDEDDREGLDNPGYHREKYDPLHVRMGSMPNGVQYQIHKPNGDVYPSDVQILSNGDLLRSPTRLQYVTPNSQSPLRELLAVNRTVTPKRQSPAAADRPVIPNRPASAGGRHPPVGSRSTPLSGISGGGQFDGSTSSRDDPVSTALARGRLMTPTVGLTVEEVNRITDSRRCTPAVQSSSSTSSNGRMSPDLVNRTDFTHNDLELIKPHAVAASPGLDSSSSDESDTNDDTFTCSDYDYARTRARPVGDFADPYRLRMAGPAIAPPPARYGTPNSRLPDAGTTSSNSSTRDDMFSIDNQRPTSTETARSGRVSTDLLRAAEILDWGPHFDAFVGIFNDIAALPDDGSGRDLIIGRTPRPNPTPRQRPGSTPRNSADMFDRSAASSRTETRPPSSSSSHRQQSPAVSSTYGRSVSSPSGALDGSGSKDSAEPLQRITPTFSTPPTVAQNSRHSPANPQQGAIPSGGSTAGNRLSSPLGAINEDGESILAETLTRRTDQRQTPQEEYV